MKGVKGTHKSVGDPCAMCAKPISPTDAMPRSGGRAGILSYCRPCRNRRARSGDKDKRNARARRHARKLREKVIDGYGGKCSCCGEAHFEFLAIDHVHGGGSVHRQTVTSPLEMCRLVIRENFPDDYRLLCHNCNSAIGWHGECPHERERDASALSV